MRIDELIQNRTRGTGILWTATVLPEGTVRLHHAVTGEVTLNSREELEEWKQRENVKDMICVTIIPASEATLHNRC